jgi:site-specific DNA-cytosine methylase
VRSENYPVHNPEGDVRILVACEFSGIVREAFNARGHDAWSCDLLPTEIPGNHIKGDVLEILNDGWDMMIAHPPCTYLSYAGLGHWNDPGRKEKREDAMNFFMKFINAPIPKICVENPRGYPSKAYRKPDQVIQPFYFLEHERKLTCIWLKNLAPLMFTGVMENPKPISISPDGHPRYFTDGMTSGKDRQKNRSRTFPGIAKAMAEQWG